MYIANNRSWYSRSGQHASGSFLMLFSKSPGREIRACVRHVKLSQCGHFMMGRGKLSKRTVYLSGTYGNDGLPMPQELAEKFWNGGGHNSAGSEAEDVREWALNNLKNLRKAGY